MLFGKKEEIAVLIEGMSCMHCASSVEKAIGSINSVKKVKVDLDKKTAYVTLKGDVKDEDIINVVDSQGFSVKEIKRN